MATAPDTAQLQQLTRVTANYQGLQGLVYLPVGALLLIGGLAAFVGSGEPFVLLGVVPALIAMGLITHYYHRRFGRVRSGEVGYQIAAAMAGLAVYLLLIVPINRLIHVPGAPDVPIWLTGVQVSLFLATMFLVGPLLRRRPGDLVLARHWWVTIGVLLCAALLPVGLLMEGGHPLNTAEFAWPGTAIAIGVPFIVGGILDHRLLVRTLSSSRAAVGEG
jgi:hypothetical protein